ncbi:MULTISPECIES: hypothetical protein [Nocardia]|uniref:hypothetical protein n=1 Tax=Nocardia TaxID=1817 RepID=UPI000D68DC24|nr:MULTISPECIES: hypothetical protein [Nocardia]
MRLHRYTCDRAAQDPSADVFHHKSWYATLYGRNEKREASIQFETILRKPQPEFSARLHVGGTWSETPFDGHLTILGSGIYWGIGAGGKLAERLTREERHKYEGRDLQVAIHDGSLWLKVWTHDGHWERGEFAEWRDRSFKLNPLDVLFGERRYWHEDVESAETVLRMPEADYPATVKLQRRTFGRPKAKKRVESWVADVDVPKGVPSRLDLSGWKGDRTYGYGVTLQERRKDWALDAQAAAEAWVLKQRAASGFRSPDPVDEVEVSRE